MKKIISVLAMCVAIASASAAIPDRCFYCRGIDEKNAFLECIEKCITGNAPVSTPANEQELKALQHEAEQEGWYFDFKEDKMVDKSVNMAVKESITTLEPRMKIFNSEHCHLALALVNNEIKNRKYMLVVPRKYKGNGLPEHFFPYEGTEYLIRVDKNKVRTLDIYGDGRDFLEFELSEDLIQEIRNGSRLMIRISGRGSENVDIEWNLSGAAMAWDTITAVKH